MAHSSPRSRTHARTILYVAPTDGTARSGAETLARVTAQTDPDLESTVQAVQSPERLRELAPDADCVVIHESTDEEVSMSVLEIVSVCGATPLVLFTDASYASAVTRSAEGIDGYVRRGTDDAVVHLADEISKVCHNEAIGGPTAESPLERADSDATVEASLEGVDHDEQAQPTADAADTAERADESGHDDADAAGDSGAGTDTGTGTDAGALEESVAHPEQTIDGGGAASAPPVIGTDRQAMRADPRTATALLETTARIVDCRDRNYSLAASSRARSAFSAFVTAGFRPSTSANWSRALRRQRFRDTPSSPLPSMARSERRSRRVNRLVSTTCATIRIFGCRLRVLARCVASRLAISA